MKKMKLSVAAAALMIMVSDLSATEGGGGVYANGAEGFMLGALPPEGLYYINYFFYYAADKFKDDNGDTAIDDLGLSAYVNVSRFVYTSPWQVLGGDVGFEVLIPLIHLDIEKFDSLPGGRSDSGLGDMIFGGIIGWHTGNWHRYVAVEVTAPTGNYDKNNAVNVGRNYFAYTPIIGTTYVTEGGYEFSGKFMYDINTENDATKYTSGNEFHIDYTASKHFGKSWNAGIGGYYYQQVTDDSGSATSANKGRVVSAGPQIAYGYKNMSFIGKYHIETLAKNKPEGQKAWFKWIYAF